MTRRPVDLHALESLDEARAPQVRLVLASDPGGRTYLVRQQVQYPFHLCRALHVSGDPPGMPTFCVQSCSGGIFEHDRLRWEIVAGPGTCARVTTAAATIVHSMESGNACQDVLITTAPGTVLEYLPEPLILFPRVRLANRLRIRLDPAAVVLACDAWFPHSPNGDRDCFDWFWSELRVEDLTGKLLVHDRFLVTGEVFDQRLTGVAGQHVCQGSFFALHQGLPVVELVKTLQVHMPSGQDIYAGASSLPNG